MQDETTTKFIGNISFNDGEKDILVSDLATVEEVNEALNQCVTNESLTNTLTEYRKIDDLSVSQRLSIGSISSLSHSLQETYNYNFNFENIPTASVSCSDEMYVIGIHLVGTFIYVDDESITYDFDLTYRPYTSIGGRFHVMNHGITIEPAANIFVWDRKNSGGMWLTNGTSSNYTPTYYVVLKSATVGPEDNLVLNSQLENYALKSDIPDLDLSEFVKSETLQSYATKEDLIPYDIVICDEWERVYYYPDVGHTPTVTLYNKSMGDYVKIVCCAYYKGDPEKILQLGNVGDTEFTFEMLPGTDLITCRQDGDNIVFDNTMDNINLYELWIPKQINKVSLNECIQALTQRIANLEAQISS